MFSRIKADIKVVFERDPAARNFFEVLLCYPGVHALIGYRFAHWLWGHNFRIIARLVAHTTRFFTGIEIHPGAQIGPGFLLTMVWEWLLVRLRKLATMLRSITV